MPTPWPDWTQLTTEPCHRDRIPLLRVVPYTYSSLPTEEELHDDLIEPEEEGTALTLNAWPGGLCLLVEREFRIPSLIRLTLPLPVQDLQTPTVASVRWVRALPFSQDGLYVAGLQFVF